MLLTLFYSLSGTHTASTGHVATGNQGVRCSQYLESSRLPLNSMECGFFVWKIGTTSKTKVVACLSLLGLAVNTLLGWINSSAVSGYPYTMGPQTWRCCRHG